MVDQKNFRFRQEVMKCRVVRHDLDFHRPAKTSRDVLKTRPTWFLVVFDQSTGVSGVGECAPISGLSAESIADVESFLRKIEENCVVESEFETILNGVSSIRFAWETAILDMDSGGKRNLFPQTELRDIPINGLVWMNEIDTMRAEAKIKIQQGFDVIKLKIGALDFASELSLVQELREEFPHITIRLDANGAFDANVVMQRLDELAPFRIHSIEQPIRQKQLELMSEVIKYSPIPVALDEELIGVNDLSEKRRLMETLQPHFIILKPSLHGGFSGCDAWIKLASEMNTRWWATSALESSIGLNAIARWVLSHHVEVHQGLGTGMLFQNNIDSPWQVRAGQLSFNPNLTWNDKGIQLS